MSNNTKDRNLDEFTPATTTEEVPRCIICPLETSQRKTAYLQEAIDEWQALAKTAVD